MGSKIRRDFMNSGYNDNQTEKKPFVTGHYQIKNYLHDIIFA